MSRRIAILLLSSATVALTPCLLRAQAPSRIFRISTDEFWLNLHHFLYVLGRAENREADATREAVINARTDADSGIRLLSDGEQNAWRRAVAYYAAGPSRKNLIFDAPYPAIGSALAAAKDSPTLSGFTADSALARVLEVGAPAYRKVWWPVHQRANADALRALEPLIARHGDSVLTFITRVYGMQWPADGYPVHLSGYANWSGAYSTTGNLLVMSSLQSYARTLHGLEILFHEAMHQWDDTVFSLLRTPARALGGLVPNDLSHAMIFFTAGEAVRRVVPGHVPYGEVAGVWNRGMRQFREPLIETWKPYLDGNGTRDEALAALLRRTVIRRPPDS